MYEMCHPFCPYSAVAIDFGILCTHQVHSARSPNSGCSSFRSFMRNIQQWLRSEETTISVTLSIKIMLICALIKLQSAMHKQQCSSLERL
jgi:hypothetical protein